ncbi:response regulator [Pseudomonas nunensis]|uniref:response regulator n=1 Tax=Pseudomonas nunensis TaxID=2961896 RepID=UPI0025B0DF60|nr:response regulator [Pseudomonas nunensis]
MSVDLKVGQPVLGHVIVVEDEPVIRMLLEEFLAELGYASAGFDIAIRALSYLVHIEGDCTFIIADHGLPGGMQGAEFIRIANERWPSIPSILVSGYSVEEQLIPLSATFLQKPYTLAELENAIATAISYRAPQP